MGGRIPEEADVGGPVSWRELEEAAPDFAARLRARFQMGTNNTLATLRRDGSPRISATEVQFQDGELTCGMMAGSLKLLDVRRDPRIALHSATIAAPDDQNWPGDAKLAGVVEETPEPADNTQAGAGFFRFRIAEAVLTFVGEPADHLVVESWHPGIGVRRRRRE